MFKFEQILVPVYIRQQMENLVAENAELRQQVAEQADALIELAGMYEEAIDTAATHCLPTKWARARPLRWLPPLWKASGWDCARSPFLWCPTT